MKNAPLVLVLIACLGSVSAAPAPEKVRTIEEIPGFPLRVLKRTISPTIYKHLRVSPVEAWVEVRARLSGTHLFGARVIHSEADGAYDGYALRLARETEITGFFSVGHIHPTTSVLINVLIYEIADGTMALSFPYLDEAGGEQMGYYGATTLATQQSNGEWIDLKLPLGPTGKVWSVRTPGLANNWELTSLLDKCIE
ncbi:MAG: hypothetical protein H0X34_00480 [Chthoniobacterales bacterium]|nr:hypothetical protein [Chthoniobacterales bacterium]